MNKTDKELAVELVVAQLQHNSKVSSNSGKSKKATDISENLKHYYSVLSELPVNLPDHKE